MGIRTLIFRGKTEEGKWLEGYLHKTDGVGKGYRAFAIQVQDIDSYMCRPHSHEVQPKTVGQFTGFTDKNGKKIFEGDIVDCWSEGVNAQGTVQQRRDGLWIIYPAWQKHIMWGLCPDEYSHTTVEIIGNIHDNPELLEK